MNAKRDAPRESGFRRRLGIAPGSRFRLSELDTRATLGHDKGSAARLAEETRGRLAELQERLWAENRQRLLIVLQGIDSAGKGGTMATTLRPDQRLRADAR